MDGFFTGGGGGEGKASFARHPKTKEGARAEAERGNSLRSHPKTKARARGGGIDNVNKDE